MKRHVNHSRDYFDDYSAEGEENSLPAEDNFSRPSRAWWESREDIGTDDISDDELAAILGSELPEDVDLGDFDPDTFDPAEYTEGDFADGAYTEEAPEAGMPEVCEPSPEEPPYEEPAPAEYEAETYAEPEEDEFRKLAPKKQPRAAAPAPKKAKKVPAAAPAKEEKPSKRRAEPKEADNWAPKVKKQKTFGRRIGRYVVILCIVFAALWGILWIALGRYQNKQDTIAEAEALQQAKAEEEAAHALAVKRAPQLAFEEWFGTRTGDEWAELWYADHPDAVDGKDRVAAYLAELFASEDVGLYKGLDSTEEAPVFVIKNSQQELGRVTMTGSDVNWSVDKAELCLKGDKSASVRVTTGAKVFCNGVELTEEYASEAKSTFSYEPLKDQLINPVSWATYEVTGMLLEPELTFEAPEGCSITETADGDCLLCLSDAGAAEYQTKAVNFVKAYLYYYLSGLNGTYGNLSNALLFLSPGSQAYTDLQDTYNGVVWNSAHTEIDTSKTEAGGVVIWADNCYSVDVTYDATGNVQGQVDEYAATMRVYFTKTDAGFAITHFETL